MTDSERRGSIPQPKTVAIVGGGLVGCLAALAFQTKGYNVTLYDLRPDPTLITDRSRKNLRSINLAVSNRGIRALQYVDEDMAQRILQHIIPMKGRMIHDKTGTKQESQLYGLFGESINSIDRSFLNECLIKELKEAKVNIHFNHKLTKVSGLGRQDELITLSFVNDNHEFITAKFDYLIGADGAHSQVRYQMQPSMRMNFSQKYIDMQYLELYIPPNEDPEAQSKFSIDANHLHIWPRHNFMLIALANKDGSFTSTFFSPWSVIESIKSSDEFVTFFASNFPDAFKLIGEEQLKSVFENNPRGSLMQVDVYPYSDPLGKSLLIGDAAHSMVPFYGQGMNCGFEDVRVLMELLEKNENNVTTTFQQYSDVRKKDLDAICKLALDNYYEMSSKVTNVWYLLRKKLDYTLGRYLNGRLIQWLPLYTMISFRDDIPYAKAIAIEKRQARILNRIEYGTIGAIGIFAAVKAATYWHNYYARNH
ncbi:kynurenine 3-monooxygenase mitochondrial precursor [Scheffersomyces coipomensis]|uniref:kynurenine 3-monooxygenase mitochondrial precursor n=1 Tax=Scheffersomyces coipomensis TaxID=1788519 RepID=UPI00315CAF06